MKPITHKHARKNRKGIRDKGILWRYNWDGEFKERYSKFDKRYWSRRKRRVAKNKLFQEQYDET